MLRYGQNHTHPVGLGQAKWRKGLINLIILQFLVIFLMLSLNLPISIIYYRQVIWS